MTSPAAQLPATPNWTPSAGDSGPDAVDTRRCVRCGRGPRADDSYLCASCKADQATFREMSEARREVRRAMPDDDGRNQRRYLIGTYHWAGGWPAIGR